MTHSTGQSPGSLWGLSLQVSSKDCDPQRGKALGVGPGGAMQASSQTVPPTLVSQPEGASLYPSLDGLVLTLPPAPLLPVDMSYCFSSLYPHLWNADKACPVHPAPPWVTVRLTEPRSVRAA